MAKKRKAAETQGNTPPPHLPPDIVESILARLPVKSIIRFKSVSTLWNQITSEPHFPKIHSQHVAASSSFPTRFLVQGNPDDSTPASTTNFCLLNFQGERFQLDANLGTPFGGARIVSYCNGLVLLNWKKTYLLWNPCSRMHTTIPPCSNDSIMWGLCYDPTTDDYKVVMIHILRDGFSVFSCKRGVWTKRNVLLRHLWLWIGRKEGLYVDGACYWIFSPYQAYHHNPDNILCFNGIEDKFETLALPQPKAYAELYYDIMLVNLRGKLGAIYLPLTRRPHSRILIMEKEGHGNSWRHLSSINLENMAIPNTLWHWKRWERQRRGMLPCPISDSLVIIFFGPSTYFVYDVCEERVVKGPLEFTKWWDGMFVPFHEHLFLPMSGMKRKSKRRSFIPLKRRKLTNFIGPKIWRYL